MSTKSAQPAGRRLRVLIADDSQAIRSALSSLIARIPGIEIVGVASTGAEALAMIRSLKPDAVTLDVRMPEMTGITVLEHLKKDGPMPFVIVLTAIEEVEYRRRCLELGAKHFFHKATEFEQVIDILAHQAAQPPTDSV